MSCRICEDFIFADGLTKEWYMDIQTSEWDSVGGDWIYEKVYINFCCKCGLDYRDKKDGKR